MIKKTVLPTRFQLFMNKRCYGVLANLVVTFFLTVITFVLFSLLLTFTAFEEDNIRLIAVVTALASPFAGCFAGVLWHKRLLYKKGYANTDKEIRSDVLKNILISILIYFSVIMFL